MIKKIFLVTMLSCLTLMLQAAKKDTVTVDHLRFEINEEQTAATLLIYPDANHKYSGDVIIPSSIAYAENQLPVTAIGYGAFKDCAELRTINIPTSIKSIGKDAFQGCSGLYTAEYYNLDHLYDIAYDNEKSNPLSFTRMLLINGKEVNTLSINKNVPNYSFCQATWLKNVTFTDAVTTIGERGFYGCTSLSEITLPNSITLIRKLAFRECKFTSIVIPDNCELESDVFQKCQQLTTVKLPANLKEIPSALFDGCIMLQDLTLPEGVKTIKERAFQNCNKLTKIPSNNVLKSIEDGAFQGCTGFTIIIIPATVKYIWANAFSGCKNLTDVFCLPTTPPTSKENSFGTQVSSLKLHVSADAGVLNSYKDDDKWKLFGTIDVIKNSKITFYINDQVHHIINQQGGSVVSLTGLNTPTGELFSGWDKEIPLYMPNDNLEVYGYLSKEYLVSNKILYYLRPAEQLNGNNISPRAELISIDKEKAATDTEINIPENIDDNGTNYPVITIPNRAFEGLSNLQSASLPNNTQHLGEQVFKGCSSLTSVTLPQALTTLPVGFFDGCSSLQSIQLPSNVTTISKQAFRYCSKLSELPSTSKWQSVGAEAFKGCSSLTHAELPDNCEMSTDIFQNCSLLETVTLPSTLTAVPSATFDGCYKLQNITLPENITSIGKNAFRNCELLTILPTTEKLKEIGDMAFKNCRALVVVTLPSTIESIGADAFDGCTKLTDVYCMSSAVPDAAATAFSTLAPSLALHIKENASSQLLNNYQTTAPWNTFKSIDRTRQSKITFYVNDEIHYLIKQRGGTLTDSTLVTKPTIGIFSGWDKTIPAFMPNSDLAIYGYLTLEYKDNDKIHYYLRPAEQLNGKGLKKRAELIKVIKENADADTEIVIPSEINYHGVTYPVTTIDNDAFMSLTNLQKVTLPNSVTTIGESVFKGCTSLAEVTLPSAITTISKAMFDGCSSLSTLHSSKITTIMKQAFRYCISLSEVPSASSLTNIGNEAFKGCSSLTSVTLPANCDIGTDIFQGCNQLKTVTLPNTLTTIPDAIFDGCYKLQNITLPQNVTSIGKYAFRNCELLTILPTTNKLTTIGNQAFRGCRGLTVINLPESIESIGNEAFRDCNKLTEVYCLPSNMPEAAEDAFDTLVQSLALHVAVDASDELLRNYKTTAPWNSFKRIDATREASVITFYLNDSEHFKITQKGGTLVDATNLHEPTYGSFSGWDKEIPVFMPNNDLDIYGYLANELVYYGIKYLLHPSEKLNGKNLPRRAEMIKIEKTLSESDIQIDIADNISFNSEQYSVIAIADSAFNGQTIIQTINIPASISTIGKAAFKGCTSLTTIQLPDAITTISTSLFDGCTALTTFTLPANVTAIGDYAFRNCRSLSTLPTSTTLKTIGQGAFQNCIALTTLVMDKMTSLQAIHKEAFTGCQKVFSLTLPASLTVLEQGAFSNCPKLQDVFCLAENVPTTDPTAFGGTQENINLFVPENSLAGYQAQEPWKSFATIQKNGVFTLTFYVDDKIWYQTKQMGGTIIDQSRFSTPSKGIFSGWDKDVPIIMPGRNTDIFGYVSYQKEIGDFEYQLYPAEKLNGKNLEKRAIVLRVVKKLTQNITTLQVPEEVSLEDVTYPVVQIAERVFEGSIYLERIILPTSITSIGNGVFRNCSSLKAVSNFPTTLETLSDNLFEGCRSMTQFQISENVKNIGKQAFNGCVSLKDILLPAGLKTLGMQAFANSAIEQIVLPASLTTLGDEVFKQCRQLRQATFAEGFVQPLSRLFFWDCQALEKVTLQGTMIDIMEGAFQGCTSLTSFAIPEGIINLNSRVFKDCSNLTSITLPASLEIVGRECFSGCLAITQLTANSTQAPSANVDAFEQEVYNYAQLYVPSIEPYQEEEPWKFFRNMTVSQEYTLTYIVDGEQYKQLSLLVGSAIIPEEEPVKEGHRFSGWLQLPTVMPAKNVSVCGNFQYQIRFYENEVKESNRLLNDELYTYYYGDEVTLPAEELKRVNHWYVITGLTEDPMGEEDAEVFQSTMPANDLNLVVTYHKSEDELVLNDITYKIFVLKKYAEVVTAVKTLETVVIPDNVSYEGEDLPVLHIQANAFRDCLKLREVTLPTHLLTIGNQAFYNCSVLTSAPLPSELQSIGLQAFARTSLSEATLPASITQMDKEVFLWCSKLKSVNYQASLDTIPNRTFQNCVSLTSITLPEQVTAIDEFAFEGCSSLKDVVFSDHFTTIGEGAFKDCSAITELTLPASVETIGDKAFINVLREGDVITLLGTTLPDAVKTTFDDIAYEQALLRTQVETLTGNCWPYFQHVRLYDPSGIQSIHADQLSSDAPIYDLNGRLVAPAGSTIRLPKGIYIQRGKRILVK